MLEEAAAKRSAEGLGPAEREMLQAALTGRYGSAFAARALRAGALTMVEADDLRAQELRAPVAYEAAPRFRWTLRAFFKRLVKC